MMEEYYEKDIPDYDLWAKRIESAIRIWPDILSDYFHIALYHLDLDKPYHTVFSLFMFQSVLDTHQVLT